MFLQVGLNRNVYSDAVLIQKGIHKALKRELSLDEVHQENVDLLF